MSKLDPRIEAVREQYDLPHDAFWQIPQNKQWVCKHAALEVVAVKANVEWALPQVIQADTEKGIAVLAVSGKLGDRVEWSTGEATPKNNKNSYPWAMAEKRAKDRVILKLVGIHGLVYSEDEMPSDTPLEPKPQQREPEVKTQPKAASRAVFDELVKEMRMHQTKTGITAWFNEPDVKTRRKSMPNDWQDNLKEECSKHAADLPDYPNEKDKAA